MERYKDLINEIANRVKASEEYEIYSKAQDLYNSDKDLQAMLIDFNNLRDAMYKERDAEKIDKAKVIRLQQDMQALYTKIMSNENMKLYTEARNAFDDYTEKIHNLINAEIYGYEESGCTGSCATCAGCH